MDLSREVLAIVRFTLVNKIKKKKMERKIKIVKRYIIQIYQIHYCLQFVLNRFMKAGLRNRQQYLNVQFVSLENNLDLYHNCCERKIHKMYLNFILFGNKLRTTNSGKHIEILVIDIILRIQCDSVKLYIYMQENILEYNKKYHIKNKQFYSII